MSAHDVVWGLIVAGFVFGGPMEWVLSRLGEKGDERDDA